MTEFDKTAWAQLSHGMRYDYTNGVIHGDFSVQAMAWSLAGMSRYNAWTYPYWSVASHACLVAEILAANADNPPSVIFGGLNHANHEVFSGDILRPFMDALPEETVHAIKLQQGKAQRAIMKALGVHHLMVEDSSWGARIGAADLAALETERRILFDVRMPWVTEKFVDPRMLEDGTRIMSNGFGKIAFGAAAADRFVSRFETLLKLSVRS